MGHNRGGDRRRARLKRRRREEFRQAAKAASDSAQPAEVTRTVKDLATKTVAKVSDREQAALTKKGAADSRS